MGRKDVYVCFHNILLHLFSKLFSVFSDGHNDLRYGIQYEVVGEHLKKINTVLNDDLLVEAADLLKII